MQVNDSENHTRQSLRSQLEAAGLRAGECVLVHSSLKAVGWIRGGPIELIKALRDVLTDRGTLVMPTFTFSLDGWGLGHYDRWSTSSRVGLLTDLFWRLEGVLRSAHPTHSVAAWGQHAEHITADALASEPLGMGSAVDRVRELDGHILLIGVGQNRNSTVHLAESRARMDYLRVPFSEYGATDIACYQDDSDHRIHELEIREMPGSSEGFDVLEEPLRRRGVVAVHQLGAAAMQVMESRALCAAVEDLLAADPLLLLRGFDPSEITLRRRQHQESLLARRLTPDATLAAEGNTS